MKPEPLKWKRRCPDCLEVETAGDQCKKGCSERIVFLDEEVRDAVEWLKQKVYRFSEDEGINMSTDDCIALIELAFEDVMK